MYKVHKQVGKESEACPNGIFWLAEEESKIKIILVSFGSEYDGCREVE